MTESTQPTVDAPEGTPQEKADDQARAEFERLLVLAKMPEQERIAACDQEIGSVLKRWRCALVIQVQLINGIPKYDVALRGL